MKKLEEAIKYMFNNTEYNSEGNIGAVKRIPFTLAMMISYYAHRNQLRVNGEKYFTHPKDCLDIYLSLIGLEEISVELDFDLIDKLGIPFDGVYDLCLLHDVIEDTDFTIDDLEECYKECGHKDYFDRWVKEELLLLTHDKSEEYDIYLDRILNNKKASLVKMIDMMSNSRVYTLDKFSEKEYKRGLDYYNYIYKINNKYHFIEAFDEYRRNNKKGRTN